MELGRTGRDVVTGFQGVITGECRYMTGCTQVVLVDKVDKDGKARDKWFDISRVEYVGDDVVHLVSQADDQPSEDTAPDRAPEPTEEAVVTNGGPQFTSSPPSH